jgi:hypothetical protein
MICALLHTGGGSANKRKAGTVLCGERRKTAGISDGTARGAYEKRNCGYPQFLYKKGDEEKKE